MSAFFGDWHSWLVLLLAGIFPNEIWRVIGLWIGKRIDEKSELLVWVRAVATAILAGVIVQLLLSPPGALADVPPIIRYTSVVVGFLAYLAIKRSVVAGVLVGEIYVVISTWLMT